MEKSAGAGACAGAGVGAGAGTGAGAGAITPSATRVLAMYASRVYRDTAL